MTLFKLLSFFVMPSLLFVLLFIGFPLGGFFGARYFPVQQRAFLRSLWLLQLVMVASVAASFLAKNFDYLRAHLFDVEVGRLLSQIAIFALLFMPFFVANGLSEYLGYQVGRRFLAGQMQLVYALYLFGAAAAYLFLQFLFSELGLVRTLAFAFFGTALAIIFLEAGKGRLGACLELVLLGGGVAFPGLEESFLRSYKSREPASAWDFQSHLGCRTVFQKWGRYSLCEILVSPDGSDYYGFYNDILQWEYSPGYGFHQPSLGAVPILETKPGSRLAIVGAGGGRQVRLAQRLGRRDVVAIEIEPVVFEAVRSPEYLLHEFGKVYDRPGVRAVRAEARAYLEKSTESFDLIYLPSVGGYPQMMIEPGNMIRTFEAYRLMRDRLTEDGFLAIWYPNNLDSKGILTDQYVRTLRQLGLKTVAFQNAVEFLILAYRNPNAEPPRTDSLLAKMIPAENPPRLREWLRSYPEEMKIILPREYAVAADPSFASIPDDKPFLAGNVRYVLSMEQVVQLFGTGGAVFLAVGLFLLFGLRQCADPGIPDRSYWSLSGLAFLLGANFLVIENFLVLALFRRLFCYYDSLILGAVFFLVLSGIGSMMCRRWGLVLLVAAAAAMVLLLSLPRQLSAPGVMILAAPVCLTTGTFFPALFERAAVNPLAVFAFDAIGAGFGALVAAFVPIAFGFDVFFVIAGALFLFTMGANFVFHYRLPATLPCRYEDLQSSLAIRA